MARKVKRVRKKKICPHNNDANDNSLADKLLLYTDTRYDEIAKNILSFGCVQARILKFLVPGFDKYSLKYLEKCTLGCKNRDVVELNDSVIKSGYHQSE